MPQKEGLRFYYIYNYFKVKKIPSPYTKKRAVSDRKGGR